MTWVCGRKLEHSEENLYGYRGKHEDPVDPHDPLNKFRNLFVAYHYYTVHSLGYLRQNHYLDFLLYLKTFQDTKKMNMCFSYTEK